MVTIRVPKVASLETAIRIYYTNDYLISKDIHELFGRVSSATVARLKRIAQAYIEEHDIPVFNAMAVNTKAAFAAWGLDIDDMERRYHKLKQLAL